VANQIYQFVVRKGPKPGQIYELTEDAITIGRDPSSDIVLNDAEISRHHARLKASPSGYILQDMASTNGTFVDGKRLGGEPYPLRLNQVVMFGSNIIVSYKAVPGPDPMATVVAPASVQYDEEELFAKPAAEPAEEPEAPAVPVVQEEEIPEVVLEDEVEEAPLVVEEAEVEEEEIAAVIVPGPPEEEEVVLVAAAREVSVEDEIVIEAEEAAAEPSPDEEEVVEVEFLEVDEVEEEIESLGNTFLTEEMLNLMK